MLKAQMDDEAEMKARKERKKLVIDKWLHIRETQRTAINLVMFKQDFVVFGGRGCGKTEFIKETCFLDDTTPHIVSRITPPFFC